MNSLPVSDDLSVAVVTGGHAHDVPGFHQLFRAIPGADCYIQHMEDFVCDGGRVRDDYDVVLFYNMPQPAPPEGVEGWQSRIAPVLEELGSTSQGIFVFHHAILTYWDWPFWSDVVGIGDRHLRAYHHDEALRVEIADPEHPITRGLSAWDIVDETYEMEEPDTQGEGGDNHLLLTVDHPRSMRAVGWTRTFRQARVFCLELGHDNQAYANNGLRKVVERGIRWCGRKI